MASIINNTVLATTFDTDLGWMAAIWAGDQLQSLIFGHPDEASLQSELAYIPSCRGRWSQVQEALADRLKSFSAGNCVQFDDVPLALEAWSDFEQSVIRHCRRIPYGKVRTYADLATVSGYPRAARAVGNVMAKNPVPLVVPCHRVVPAENRKYGRYSARGGADMKTRLLRMEGAGRTYAIA